MPKTLDPKRLDDLARRYSGEKNGDAWIFGPCLLEDGTTVLSAVGAAERFALDATAEGFRMWSRGSDAGVR